MTPRLPLSITVRKCAKCDAPLTRSRRSKKIDKIVSVFFIYPYRCQTSWCKHRCYRLGRE